MISSGSSSSSWGNVFWERWLQLWRFHGQSCDVELTEGPPLGEIKHSNNGINLGTQHPTSSNDSEAAVVLFLGDSHAFRMWLSQKKMGSYSVLPPIWFIAFWFIGPAMWGWVIFSFKTSCHFGESGHPVTSYDSGYHEWWHSRWTASPSNAFNFSILAAARTSFWVRPENWGVNGLTNKNGV